MYILENIANNIFKCLLYEVCELNYIYSMAPFLFQVFFLEKLEYFFIIIRIIYQQSDLVLWLPRSLELILVFLTVSVLTLFLTYCSFSLIHGLQLF